MACLRCASIPAMSFAKSWKERPRHFLQEYSAAILTATSFFVKIAPILWMTKG